MLYATASAKRRAKEKTHPHASGVKRKITNNTYFGSCTDDGVQMETINPAGDLSSAVASRECCLIVPLRKRWAAIYTQHTGHVVNATSITLCGWLPE